MSAEPSSTRIGIVGLGNAGRALLEALSSTHEVRVFDRAPEQSREAARRFTHAPLIASNVGELSAWADVVLLSLPTPAASLEMAMLIAPAIRPGTVVIETSTVQPKDVEALETLLGPRGAIVFDAAIIGGVTKLAAGEGVFLVGATERAAGAAANILHSIAEEIFFLGARGAGMRSKLVANAVSHTAYVVLLEAAALAAAQKIPLDVFYRLMERESGLMRPLTHRFRDRLRKSNFHGGMSTINARKDSALILDTARELGVPLFAIAASHGVYELAVAEGLGSLDYASMGKLWEKWLGVAFAERAHLPDDP